MNDHDVLQARRTDTSSPTVQAPVDLTAFTDRSPTQRNDELLGLAAFSQTPAAHELRIELTHRHASPVDVITVLSSDEITQWHARLMTEHIALEAPIATDPKIEPDLSR